nr:MULTISPECIES: DUF982 domain-containing protein [unclassified Mesorhizobium]
MARCRQPETSVGATPCRRATSGDVSPDIAREAFVEAAREAHVLVE